MAKKRVFLDECLGREELGPVFGAKAHIYTAKDLGVRGKEDIHVIDAAVAKKCLIVTVNRDFLDYYRNHPRRRGTFFYGLIFLRPSKNLTRQQQIRKALKETAWAETRDHDDLIIVNADGSTAHERLCHPECAKELAEQERLEAAR